MEKVSLHKSLSNLRFINVPEDCTLPTLRSDAEGSPKYILTPNSFDGLPVVAVACTTWSIPFLKSISGLVLMRKQAEYHQSELVRMGNTIKFPGINIVVVCLLEESSGVPNECVEGEVKHLLEKFPMLQTFPVALDDGNVFQKYIESLQIQTTPSSVIFNAQGETVWFGHPFEELSFSNVLMTLN